MTASEKNQRILLPGGAGLVGQNLVVQLKAQGYSNLVVLDKHRTNLALLQQLHPDLTAEYADLAEPGEWQRRFHGADAVVMLQAQIGGTRYTEFERNNIEATRLILQAMKEQQVPYLVHISSSVITSIADDFYTQSKKQQEQLVLASGISGPILRPTLMFGWFDRKHLGWLARFMQKVPLFPIPGDGRYRRQPLYVGDFCQLIIRCLEQRIPGGIYNISGHETLDYIDIIRAIKQVTQSNTPLIKIPYSLFYGLLWLWSQFDRNPPFTTQQLAALTAKDDFEVIDWPAIFGASCTPFAQAIAATFTHPIYSKVTLAF